MFDQSKSKQLSLRQRRARANVTYYTQLLTGGLQEMKPIKALQPILSRHRGQQSAVSSRQERPSTNPFQICLQNHLLEQLNGRRLQVDP